jgi:hypothetical protein
MVGSRTSASADFIRGVTCAISPYASESFCTTPLPVPQYVPVTNGVGVSVKIYSDPYHHEIAWKITDLSGLSVYALATFGTSTKDYTVTNLMLSPGGSYMFTIMDAADDGIFGDVDATLYEVILIDQGVNLVLVGGNGAFTTSRSATFSVPVVADYSSLVASTNTGGGETNLFLDASLLAGKVTTTVKIYILFADYHEDLSWMVTDANDENEIYASVPPDHYRYGYDVEERIQLPAGIFNFIIRDRRGTDDFRSFKAFSVSYTTIEGQTISVIEQLGAIASDKKAQTFEIPTSAVASSAGSGGTDAGVLDSITTSLCLALQVPCNIASDCCSGRCVNGQCRSKGGGQERDKYRIGIAHSGGAASRAAVEPNK